MAVVVSLGLLCALEWTFEWYKLYGLAAVGPFALLNLFYLLRNRTIMAWLWEDEKPLYETPNTNGNAVSGSATFLRT